MRLSIKRACIVITVVAYWALLLPSMIQTFSGPPIDWTSVGELLEGLAPWVIVFAALIALWRGWCRMASLVQRRDAPRAPAES